MSRRLSIFVDESGDFGSYQPHAPYYLVTMLFHDQGDNITHDISHLDANVKNIGFEPHALHTGPLIRRESFYLNRTKDERKKLLRALLSCCQHIRIQYTTVIVEKKECADTMEMIAKISRRIGLFIVSHYGFFHSFDEVIVYYDNGQVELTRILTSTLSVLLTNVSFRRVKPSDYKLFQLADMFCTFELIALKFESSAASRTELDFFHSVRDFKRNYLKEIRQKRLD